VNALVGPFLLRAKHMHSRFLGDELGVRELRRWCDRAHGPPLCDITRGLRRCRAGPGAASPGCRSRRPHTSPNATSGEVVGKIVHLRKTYHFGPAKISMYLKRYHDLEVSTSGV
jgi:hypothetical protein